MSETPNWTESKGIARGTIVGRYVVVQKLGALTARTYEAYDPEHDRKVALKVVHFGDLEHERLRFRREAQRLTELSHPNIVGVHDVGTFGEHAWLAMGFVQGCRMREWFDSSRGWREVLGVLRDAGEALAAAHRFGILHGDFNPHSHVRIGDDGRARVQGFMCMLFANGPVTLDTDATGETGWVLREDPLRWPSMDALLEALAEGR